MIEVIASNVQKVVIRENALLIPGTDAPVV
jgi:hypothetical protein